MTNDRKYFIKYGVNTREVFPINDSEIDYVGERKDGTIYLSKSLKSKLVFSNDAKIGISDFTFFYGFESNPALKCTEFDFLIQVKCDGLWKDEFTGEFTLNDADWDLDRCKLSVNVSEKTVYTCITKKKKLEFNLLEVPSKHTVINLPVYNGFEFYACFPATSGTPCSTLPGPNPSTWRFLHSSTESYDMPTIGSCASGSVNLNIMYRESQVTICNNGLPVPPVGFGWLLEDNNSSVNNTCRWVRANASGSLTPVVSTNLLFSYYDSVTLESGGYNRPYKRNIVVTNTPASEPIIGYTVAQISGIAGTGTDWFYYVQNNPNSTYLWSYTPTSGGSEVMNIVSGQGTNEIRVNFTGVFTTSAPSVITVTETHGNGHISTSSLTIGLVNTSTTYTADNWVHDYSVMNTYDGYTFIAPKPPVSTSGSVTITLTNINTSGYSGSLGPRVAGVPYAMNFLVHIVTSGAGTLDIQNSYTATIVDFNVQAKFIGISEQYPNEQNINYKATLLGGLYNMIWRNGTTVIPSVATVSIISNAYFGKQVAGTYCLSMQYIEYTAALTGPSSPIFSIPAYNISVWVKPGMNIPGAVAFSTTYPNQVRLKEVFELIVLSKLNCGVSTVNSDFFQWNPIKDTPNYQDGINYLTNGLNKLQYITIGSSSDVINNTASNHATKCDISFEKLEEILIYVFNAFWFIDKYNRFRIEHVSWFNRLTSYSAIDLTNVNFNIAKNKYTYDKTKIPRKETFKFQNSITEDFLGEPIIYSGLCVNKDIDNNEKEYNLQKVITDVNSIPISPTDFDIRSYTLMCINPQHITTYVDYMDIEVGKISNQSRNNGHLSWANLHYNYHRHNRPLSSGSMNGTVTDFKTVKKNKSQKDIILIACCPNNYDFILSLVKTELGNGEVKSYEENKKKGIIKLTLLHN